MGLPRYENIDQLPNIAMATRTQIEYIVMQTLVPGVDEDAIAELQAIIRYLMYLLDSYQPQLLPVGENYVILKNFLITTMNSYNPNL